MTIYERIKAIRLERGMSMEELAQKVGYVGRSAIAKVESGERHINHEMLIKYAEALNVSPMYLLFGDGYALEGLRPITRKRFPMLGEISCGKPIFATEDHESYIDAADDIDADFCLIAHGDSMTGARIFDGDVVFIKQQSIVNNGEIAAVCIGDECTLKYWYYYPDKKKLVLNPANPAHEPLIYTGAELETITCLGRAVCFISYL